LIEAIFWMLAWWQLWATSAPWDEGAFVRRQVWYFPDEGGRWFEARTGLPHRNDAATLLLERTGPSGRPIGRRLLPPLFRLHLADIDADGSCELIAGIERTIRKKTWRRVYVYRARRPDFPPLWLGSRLSFVLRDFTVTPVRGRTGLRASELRFGRPVVSTYLWYTFGFRTVSAREDHRP